MEIVRSGTLPVWFGSPHPTMAIVEQDGKLRIRALEIDMAEAMEKSREALAAGRGWMPENHYALGRPTGRVYAEADSREALLEVMAAMEWPAHW